MSLLRPSSLLLEENVKILMSKICCYNERPCVGFLNGIKVGKHEILNSFLHHRQYPNIHVLLTSICKKSFTSTVNTTSSFITGKNMNIIFC